MSGFYGYFMGEYEAHTWGIQRPKLSKNMLFGAVADIYMAVSKMDFW